MLLLTQINIKNIMKKLFTSILIVGILGSCSIDKRLYRPGYSVKWNNSTTTSETNKKASATEGIENEPANYAAESSLEEGLTSSIENSFVPLSKPKNVFFESSTKNTEPQIASSNSTINTNDVTKQYSKRELKKAFFKEYKNAHKSLDDDKTLLYVLLILLVPFGTTISMYLYEGQQWTSRVTTNLILTLLCYLPGIIHSLFVILGKK